ncbi:hypothetical protein OHA37_08585 [Streptomyces sp. NBC_00335]|uniref:hypothetical protein n=1 Tax=unclassified Streptomyces TaxID=2593676 RepID=UPI00224DE4B5|nr:MULTISPECIES: hypothetical protein [unclassified Streptomyces]MCX5403939.1 hypothetical protein [Streptomyces sp. NBC_00086]
MTGTEHPPRRAPAEPLPADPAPGPVPDGPRTWPHVLSLVASGVLGAAAGGLAISLAAHSRASCDAGRDAGGRTELALLLPVLVVGFAFCGVMVAMLTPRRHPLLRMLPVVLALGALVLWFFAVRGTLDGYPGDLGRCGPDNVPPWWPGWLPS